MCPYLNALSCRFLGGHDYEGCSPVVDARRVGGRHAAVLLEGGLEARQLVELERARLFVFVYHFHRLSAKRGKERGSVCENRTKQKTFYTRGADAERGDSASNFKDRIYNKTRGRDYDVHSTQKPSHSNYNPRNRTRDQPKQYSSSQMSA